MTVLTGSVRELVDRHLAEIVERETSGLGFVGDEGVGTVRRFLADFVLRGGKRLRPSFVYWGHRAAGGRPEDLDAVLSAGCAVELVHACALLLDDVMDESGTRRGHVTAHLALAEEHRRAGWRGDPRRHGESVATLLGLLAYTWADSAMLAAGVPRRAWEVFTRLRVELIGGQYLDLADAARGRATRRRIMEIGAYKSGKYTVERPLHLGHTLAGGDGATLAALGAYAAPLGQAFQLRDDVLGVFGDPARTGKPAGADLLLGKQTYLLAEAHARTGDLGAAILGRVRDEADVATARELIAGCGALDAAERRIGALAGEAVAALEAPCLPADAAAALVELARQATERAA
ncbi:polyprenyl synthetase family protein [Nonomuraea sp. NPDC047897]|uniref:polyprenyl synthetase family protein n=1 Tax=Nonomuraea sp. NPDC047897 TaxID=3364346 RepID=UPI00371B3DB9